MSVRTVLSSAGKPEVFSYTRLASSTKALGRRYPRQVKSAQAWCEMRGLELANDARHSDLNEADDGCLKALDSLRLALAAGRILKGSILDLEGLDGVTRGALPEAISAATALVWQGLDVVMLHEPDRVWSTHTMLDLGSFLMRVVVLYRAQETRRIRCMRARNGRRKEAQ